MPGVIEVIPTPRGAIDVGSPHSATPANFGPPSTPPRSGDVMLQTGEIPAPILNLYTLWQKTVGSLSVDIKREGWAKRTAEPVSSGPAGLFRVRPADASSSVMQRRRRGPGRPPAGAAYSYGTQRFYGQAPQVTPDGDFVSHAFGNTGARIKVLRHVQLGPSTDVTKPSGLVRKVPQLDLGVGLEFEVDTAELRPVARLKFRDLVSIQALPVPALRVQSRLTLPALQKRGLGLRLSYECPVDALTSFYRPPARLMLSIDNSPDQGIRLTSAGLEVDKALVLGGGSAVLRAAGVLGLPRSLPVEEGEPLVRIELHRLGLKTRW